jgi:hypothetical protein
MPAFQKMLAIHSRINRSLAGLNQSMPLMLRWTHNCVVLIKFILTLLNQLKKRICCMAADPNGVNRR